MKNGQTTLSTQDPIQGRVLQITVSRDSEILLARLQARWVEKGNRPADCTKSKLYDRGIRALAALEGITGDLVTPQGGVPLLAAQPGDLAPDQEG